MSRKFLPNYLSPTEAAEYLQCSEAALKHLVAEHKLKAGVFSPGWTGEAMPAPKNDGITRHWDGGIFHSDDKGITDHYRCKETGEEFKVRRGRVSQFWYLSHSDAYIIATTEAGTKAVSFLDPVDGESSHNSDLERFPHAQFLYCLDDKQEYSRNVSWEQLLFRRCDLDTLIDIPVQSGAIKKTSQQRDSSLLATVAALICCWPGGLKNFPSGKDLENAAAAGGLTISDDTLRKVLEAAKELIATTK